MDSLKKVDRICRLVLKLDQSDFDTINELANRQRSYIHPLKQAKQQRLNDMADHNQSVLLAIQLLYKTLNESPLNKK